MSLSDKTKRALVTALNPSFEVDQVNATLLALEALQATSPPIMAGSPNFGFYLPGLYYDAAFMGALIATTYTAIADRVDVAPFFVTQDLAVNEFTIGVVTGVAATNSRVVIYEAGDDFKPNLKVYESANLSTATSSTNPTVAASFTFVANKLYWIGVHNSGAPTLRGIRDYSSVNLGYNSSAWNAGGNLLARKTATFGSAPTSWGFLAADLTAAAAPSVRFKVA